MIPSISLSAAVVAFNHDPQHLTKFEDPFTHKPLDKAPIPANTPANNTGATSISDHAIDITA
ncbi:MAG: hypothetical protein KGI29_10385 [Pseudomonadota bacterium]|nr:hypothetical protein [Pseudomonadota bacterium]MDE3036950.1 hypothetical protein [Pseudomonadota bacterium]